VRSQQCVMMGYVHNTTKIWRLWDPVESRIIQASNIMFDETLIEGKCVIDEPSRDTLHDLANLDSHSLDFSEDENIDTSAETIPSRLLIEVQRNIPKRQSNSCSQSVEANYRASASGIAVDPIIYAEAIVGDQHNG